MLLLVLKRDNDSAILQYTIWFLMLMLLLFASLVNAAPEVSLAGLGATLIIMSVLIELNSAKIWSERLKSVKKLKKMSALQRPKKIYYNINVYILWPFIIFMGGLSVWSAYYLTTLK
jgi:uncharacterized membrane protein